MNLPSAPWKGLALTVSLLLLSNSLLAQTNAPARKYSAVERMKTAHLKAAHEDAERFQQARRSLPLAPGLRDFKSIIHAHAEDSDHTGGTRPEMLADAKKAGVQVIMLTDHLRPPRDFIKESWRGLHDGVLFIPGSEALGFLVFPVNPMMDRIHQAREQLIASVTESNGLIFLSHCEERLDHPMDGLTGMEIYNRHWDAKKDPGSVIALAFRLLDPAQLAELQENLRLYPDELLAAQVTYLQDYIGKWDRETPKRRLTGVAANDCHHNQVLVVKMVDEESILIGTIVDKESSMRKMTAASRPSIRELTKGHKAGDTLVRIDLDPYYRSYRDVTTHILAPELTENSIRAALQQGHAFVSHDWMCDATGFSFGLSAPASVIMGDEVKCASGQKLLAQFPVACHVRLLRDGKVIADQEGDKLEYAAAEPGVYRVEGWLKIDGEERPWIYSNPVYLR